MEDNKATLEGFAEVARTMTGSNLNTNKILFGMNTINKDIKEKILLELDKTVGECGLPFDKAFPIVKDEFNKIADKYKIDPAILFLVYIDGYSRNK